MKPNFFTEQLIQLFVMIVKFQFIITAYLLYLLQIHSSFDFIAIIWTYSITVN